MNLDKILESMAKAVTSQTICAEFAYKFKCIAFLQEPNFYSVLKAMNLDWLSGSKKVSNEKTPFGFDQFLPKKERAGVSLHALKGYIFKMPKLCKLFQKTLTTLQSVMNTKLSKQRFWHCHENRLIKTIQTIPHNPYLSFKLTSLYCGLG